MTTYFGFQSGDADYGGPNAATVWDTTAYVCPGSGNQNIQELSADAGLPSGSKNVRLGIYNSAGTILIAEGTGEAAVPVASHAFVGHMTQSGVKAAGGSSPGVLVGGTTYLLAATYDVGSGVSVVVWGYDHGGGVYAAVAIADYTSGMPSALPTSEIDFTWEYNFRCGVDPAGISTAPIMNILMHKRARWLN